MAHVREVKEID